MSGSSTTRTEHHTGAGVRMRQILGLLLLIAVVALAVDNRDDVRVGWVIGDGTAPLAAVLLLAALAGAIIGWLLVHRPHRHS